MSLKTCAGIIALRRDKAHKWEVLLVLHASGNYWGFPKGHQIPKETLQETAERELKEETGLHVTSWVSDAVFKERYAFQKGNDTIEKEVSYFLADVEGELKLEKEEIIQAKWLPILDAKDTITFDGLKGILEKVKKQLVG